MRTRLQLSSPTSQGHDWVASVYSETIAAAVTLNSMRRDCHASAN